MSQDVKAQEEDVDKSLFSSNRDPIPLVLFDYYE